MKRTLELAQRQLHQGQPHYRPQRASAPAPGQQLPPAIPGQQQQAQQPHDGVPQDTSR